MFSGIVTEIGFLRPVKFLSDSISEWEKASSCKGFLEC